MFQRRALQFIVTGSSAVPSVISLVVILGWYTGNPRLLQIRPMWVPMMYPTALCFLILSAGLLAAWFGRRRIASGCGLTIAVLGGLVLSEDLWNVDLHVDQLFMKTYNPGDLQHPGRIAINTAAALILCGLGLMLLPRRKLSSRSGLVSGVAGTVVLALAIVPLIGYMTSMEAAYTWGRISGQMAIHAAVAFVFGSIALLGLAWRASVRTLRDTPSWFPLSLGTMSLTCAVLLWRALVVQDRGVNDLPPQHSYLITIVLLSGIATSVLLGLSVHLTRATRSRTRELEAFAALLQAQISQREQVEAALNEMNDRNRLMIETANDAFVAMDAEGRITTWNRQAQEVFGWSEHEAMGHPLTDLIIPERNRTAHREMMRRFSAPGESRISKKRVERTGLRRNREEFPAEFTIWPVTVNQVVTFNAFIRDISERHRIETELKTAKNAAVAASVAKSDFLASMSHEIRTPMNAIIGMAELLSETQLSPEQLEYVGVFQRAGGNLLDLINDILDLSKVEAGKLELESIAFDLRSMLAKTMELMAMRARPKGLALPVEVHSGIPAGLVGDPNRLRQVLINLVGNAIKFTEAGSVSIRVEPEEVRDGIARIRFAVSDTGIGIAADKLNLIFSNFTQADSSTTRRYGGTGLGLSIARALVEQMKGAIQVESEVGKGSTFRFTVEFRIQTVEAAAAQTPGPQLQHMRVLVVDDSATNRRIVCEMVSGWGATVVEATGAEAALAELSRSHRSGERIDLVLMDSEMPSVSGVELVQKMKAAPESASIPVVMLSSEDRAGDIKRRQGLGIQSYVVKPVREAALYDAMMRASRRVAQPLSVSSMTAAATGTGHVCRILLCEDSEDNVLLVRSYLRAAPYELEVVGDGQAAVDRFTAGKFDLILMDVQMPVMDGYEATKRIRAWERRQAVEATPIIVLTAHALTDEHGRSAEAGCTGFLTKPIRKATLLEALKTYTQVPA